MKRFRNAFFCLTILFLNGCQSMPKEPKQPDSSPRVPINKTIPPELSQVALHIIRFNRAECLPPRESL